MTEEPAQKPYDTKGALIFGVPALIGMCWLAFQCTKPPAETAAPPETYRLVMAIGNTEREVDRDLTRPACQRRRDELRRTATALGTYNEATGQGSITCLPESYF